VYGNSKALIWSVPHQPQFVIEHGGPSLVGRLQRFRWSLLLRFLAFNAAKLSLRLCERCALLPTAGLFLVGRLSNLD
jgi:hypothetical protein